MNRRPPAVHLTVELCRAWSDAGQVMRTGALTPMELTGAALQTGGMIFVP